MLHPPLFQSFRLTPGEFGPQISTSTSAPLFTPKGSSVHTLLMHLRKHIVKSGLKAPKHPSFLRHNDGPSTRASRLKSPNEYVLLRVLYIRAFIIKVSNICPCLRLTMNKLSRRASGIAA